jgi:hypothetical protein
MTSSPNAKRPFQMGVKDWLRACFGDAVTNDREERTHRFLEEAIELAQANGCTKQEAQKLLDYVYSRPPGEGEVGGVLVTLAGVCSACGIDMREAGDRELTRNWQRIDAIRSKRALKPADSPLPQ